MQMIAGISDAPVSSIFLISNPNGSDISEDIIYNLLNTLIDIIDTQINKRFQQDDVMQLYDAQLVQIKDELNAVAECNDIEYDVKNATGIAFTENDRHKYVKIGTVDGINHIVLYKLEPDAVNISEIKNEMQKMKDEISDIQGEK